MIFRSAKREQNIAVGGRIKIILTAAELLVGAQRTRALQRELSKNDDDDDVSPIQFSNNFTE